MSKLKCFPKKQWKHDLNPEAKEMENVIILLQKHHVFSHVWFLSLLPSLNSFNFIPLSTSLCRGGWENGFECSILFLDLLVSGPLIYTLDAESNASQPALNKKGGGEEVEGVGGRERETDRTKLGVGRNRTQCLLCVWRKGLGTNTGWSVRVSCAAPCSMPASSILSLSSNCAQWHWESTHSNTWPL